MSQNVAKEFLKFKRKEITKFANLGLGSIYSKKVFEPLLDVYFNYRYYNIDNDMQKKNMIFLLNNHLVETAKELLENEENKHVSEILFYFGFIYYFDNIVDNTDYEAIANQINDFRSVKLKLEPLNIEEVVELFKSFKERLDNFLKEFESNDFKVDIINTNNKHCYNTLIRHNVKIPRLYSDYAINKVYNSGIVAENKLFVIYYMIMAKVIEDVNNMEYKKHYLVPFEVSIIEKKEKSNRIFNVIDDDMAKEHIIIKVSYQDYLDNKDFINEKINLGYRFALVLDNKFKFTTDMEIMFSLFNYILVNNDSLFNRIEDKSKLVRY